MEFLGLKDRIRLLRETLGVSQRQFAAAVEVTASTVSTYESGIRNPSDSVIALICRVYGVNREWLEDGIGDMFSSNKVEPPHPDPIGDLLEKYQLEPEARPLIEALVSLSPDERGLLLSIMESVVDAVRASRGASDAASSEPSTDELEAAYKKSFPEQSPRGSRFSGRGAHGGEAEKAEKPA